MSDIQPKATRRIYLDHHATTPCDPRVVEAMLPYFSERFANPASLTHFPGRDALGAVEDAREQVAALIGASPKEIVFTSGATEALNLAITGLTAQAGGSQEWVVSPTEHPAVLDTLDALEARGHRVVRLPVGPDGRVRPEDVAEAITEKTLGVAVMLANNEIGVVNPIPAIGAHCKKAGVFLLTDAVQAAGWMPLDVNTLQVDMMALSAHKMYGPKGVGALYVRRRNPRVRLEPLIHGGGHERGLRSGTANVPGIVGMGRAAVISAEGHEGYAERVRALRDLLYALLDAGADGLHVHGSLSERLPHNLNVTFEGVEGRGLIEQLPDIAISAGSACATAKDGPSHVLKAIGVPDGQAYGALRFGLGRTTTEDDIRVTAARVLEVVKQLRA